MFYTFNFDYFLSHMAYQGQSEKNDMSTRGNVYISIDIAEECPSKYHDAMLENTGFVSLLT